ncbi:MAG: ribosome small subunit-dependent GTPase A [Bacilli bacterium]|nr:ribosome small subunit-dependent GTPase A [Bacilli bacterium]
MKGRIVGLNCGYYSVESEGILFKVKARGALRNKEVKPVVGDIVELDDTFFIINFVYPRDSYLKRPVIANLSQMLIIQSLVEPDFSYLLTFKYLTYANMHNIKAKIILTKSDKYNENDKIEEIKETFKKLNIEVYVISNKTKSGLEEIKHIFKDEVTCLIGQTGVGKSSLINAIDENYNRQIGEYSKALGRGKHETKEVILLPYEGGYIADTPGFSSLDLELYKEDLATYFPAFSSLYTECYFSNCLHISEKKCRVKEEIEKGNIPQIAYECYLKLSEEAIYKNRRYQV